MRLAMRGISPGGSESNSGVCTIGAWRWGLTRQVVAVKSVCFEALCAWRYATPVRRSGRWQRLATRVSHQAIRTAAA